MCLVSVRPLFVFIIFCLWVQKMMNPKTCQKEKCYHPLNRRPRNFFLISALHLSLCLLLSSPFKEEPSDVREEEPHLRLRHGIHHQRHAHRSQSDVEERHGVAAPTVSGEQSQPACACQWVRSYPPLTGTELHGITLPINRTHF